MAIFKGGKGRDDTFVGGTKADRFEFDPLDLNSGDTIVGGSGRAVDVLRFTAPGAISASALAHVSGIERIELAGGGASSLVLTDDLVASANGATVQVIGSDDDELIYAARLTGANAIDYTAGAGTDTVVSGAGADTFRFDVSNLDARDTVIGGAGSLAVPVADVLVLSGSGAIGPEQTAGISGIEGVILEDGGINFTLSQALADTSETGSFGIVGGAGVDTITATGVNTSLTLNGGAGDDTILSGYGYGYTFADGGAGADTISIGQGVVRYDRDDVSEQASNGLLLVSTAATIDLTQSGDQSLGDTAIVQGFTSVDASLAKDAVTLTAMAYGTLIGGAGRDTLTGGYYMTGGAGADTLIGNAATGSAFLLAEGDFARGEVIRGADGVSDSVSVTGSVDFRTGTLTGIDRLSITATTGKHTDVMLSSAQFVGLDGISGNDAGAITVHVELKRGDVPSFYLYSSGATVDVHLTDKDDVLSGLGGTLIVHGGAGDDTLSVGGAVYGDAGNDRITAAAGAGIHDGGIGDDTLVLTGYAFDPVVIDLSARNQGVSGVGTLSGFENVDASALQYSGLTVTGSSGDNVLYGSSGADTLSGGRGDDVLAGVNGYYGGKDVLDGGAGDDLLFGSTGYLPVVMTGGGGADTFRWTVRSDNYYYYDGIDTVTDFKPGQDTLEFATHLASGGYDFAGAFDTRVMASGPRTDITGADLVIVRGGAIDGVSGVADYINSAKGGSDAGLFIAVENSAGHTVLYYSESGTYGDTYYGGITAIADLGDIKPTQLQLSDFAFI